MSFLLRASPQVRSLVAEGRLDFANAGWCMHDEAATHWIDMVDNTAIGHRFLFTNIGASAIPTAQWQVSACVRARVRARWTPPAQLAKLASP